MNLQVAEARLVQIDGDSFVQNIIAQANARYILLNTGENRVNFPNYTIVDNQLEALALYYLNIGCSLAENEQIENARFPLEKGASLLEYVHGAESNKSTHSNYYGLVSSLSYYAGFQYSKSFILIQRFEQQTIIAKVVGLFLKRDFGSLSIAISEILVDTSYQDENLQTLDEANADQKIYELVITKALDRYIKYFQTGDEELLNRAKKELNSLKEIAEIRSDPGIWWVIRLLLIVSNGFSTASLWSVLAKYFDLQLPMINTYIKSLVYLSPRGIYELFISQRNSLDKVLNAEGKGCIVNIPTSGGKTRIAEIAIIDFLSKNSDSKVLYIAPFKSLAFEIENSLVKILDNLNISISHLYGGQLFSKLDRFLVNESKLIIATPEKAKAILRGAQEILEEIKLIIVDEGHLLGKGERFISNEAFYEELRYSISKNGGRFIVLSAVLPNCEDLSKWFVNDTQSVFQDKWRPSDERLGVLEWNGEVVNLNWESNDGERKSFNRNFIQREPLPLLARQRTRRFFPSNKIEAIAATAYKLRSFGPVMIFVGRKDSVFGVAKAYLKCIGSGTDDFRWTSPDDWMAFELASTENYGVDNDWLLLAKRGILCHNSDLHIDSRLPMERLMRNDKPLVIICTSTLGQGVNLGVSSVIFSTLYQGPDLITKRDFWNIAGRSGRAFVDSEGKILVALDTSETSSRAARSKIAYHRDVIEGFFNKSNLDEAESGLLWVVGQIRDLATAAGVDWELLLQLIAENKIEGIGSSQSLIIEEYFDLIDDSLLSLHHLSNVGDEIKYDWIEQFFKGSLAYIQAVKTSEHDGAQFLLFIESRVKGIELRIGSDRSRWKSIIASGIPLRSDLILETKLSEIVLDLLLNHEGLFTIESKIDALKKIEERLKDVPIISEELKDIDLSFYDEIRSKWLKGESMAEILKLEGGFQIVNKLYSYKTPWILNGLAKKIRAMEFVDFAAVVEDLAVLVESGLPNVKAVKIYQAGIRSRTSATEISQLFDDELGVLSITDYKKEIIRGHEFYKSMVSKESSDWIDLLAHLSGKKVMVIDDLPKFTFKNIEKLTKTLIAKKINSKQFLVSPDLDVVREIDAGVIDFSSVNEVSGVFFKYDDDSGSWGMIVDNPYVETQ